VSLHYHFASDLTQQLTIVHDTNVFIVLYCNVELFSWPDQYW